MEFFGFVAFVAAAVYVYNTYTQSIRDRAARDLLSDFSSEKEIEEIKLINKNHFFGSKTPLSGENIEDNSQYCPNCLGLTLKIRNGKYGEFFGCRNYPKCNFTRNV